MCQRVEGRVEYKRKVSKIIYQLQGGLESLVSYIGAKNLKEINKKAKFIKMLKQDFYESMVHSVEMTQKKIKLQVMINKNFKIIILFFLSLKIALANTEFYQEGVNLYNSKKLTEAKFKFEQDLVQNPKSEISYLYLAKI